MDAFQEGQRVKLSGAAQSAAGCYGEITAITGTRIFVRLDGELSPTPLKYAEIAETFELTGAATAQAVEKLNSAVFLYYSRWGTVRLEQADGTIEKWYLPGDHPDKTTVEYAVWRLLDTAYRTEWEAVDFNEDYGQKCIKRP